MRALLLCILVLACTPAVAAAQSATVGTTPVAPATTATQPSEVAIDTSATSDDDGPSPAVVGLVVLLALGVVVLVCWAIARLTAWEPGWLPRVRHATGEAAYRWGGAWAQVRDWLGFRRSRRPRSR